MSPAPARRRRPSTTGRTPPHKRSAPAPAAVTAAPAPAPLRARRGLFVALLTAFLLWLGVLLLLYVLTTNGRT